MFVLRGDEGSEPYVSKTANLRRRLQRLLGASEGPTRKLNLRDRVRWVEWTPAGSDFEASFLLYQTLRREFPKTYEKRLAAALCAAHQTHPGQSLSPRHGDHAHRQHEE